MWVEGWVGDENARFVLELYILREPVQERLGKTLNKLDISRSKESMPLGGESRGSQTQRCHRALHR